MTNKWILPSSTALAITLSFILFAFMAHLVKKPDNRIITTQGPDVEVLFQLDKPEEQTKKVHRILKPKQQNTVPPHRPPIDISQTTQASKTTPTIENTFDLGIPTFGDNSHTIENPTLSENNNNTDARAIVQIPPQYPIEAQQKGIEGWVKLSFSIDTDGSVTNIKVVDSQPKNTFERAARKALKGWRYKAKFVNAVPVMQHNMMIQLDFELEK